MLTRTSARRRPLGVAVAVGALVSALVLPLMPAADASAAPLAPVAQVAGPETRSDDTFAWRVVERVGQALVPVSGVTFRVEVADGQSGGWTQQAIVADCVQTNCGANGTWADLDPDVGEFQLIAVGNGTRSYRVSVATAPAGYTADPATFLTYVGKDFRPAANLGDLVLGSRPAVPCTTAFALLGNGAVQQVAMTPGSTPAAFGAWTGLAGQANGLAAGPDSQLFAVDRSESSLNAILRYDTAGGWQRIPVSTSVSYSIVAGAYDRASSRFLFGGFTTSGSFQLHQYDAQRNAVALVGTIATGASSDGSGDMAFDGAGNLVIMRAGATSVATFTVAASALAAANGGSIVATAGSPREVGLSGINGAAFADDGSVLLSNATTLRRYDPITWTQRSEITTGLGPGATDLATCAVPAANSSLTVAVQVTARDVSSDVFTVSASSGGTTLGPASTGSGSTAQAGPVPVIAGSTYTVVAALSAGTRDSYSSRISCTGVAFTPVDAWSTPVTVPAGASVSCTVTVSPIRTVVTVRKWLSGTSGMGPLNVAGVDWLMTVTAASDGTTTGPVQRRTGSDGVTAAIAFTHSTASTITVEESQQAAYVAESVTCTVIAPGAAPVTTNALATTRIQLTAVPRGSKVDCAFTNREKPTTLTLRAADGTANAEAWRLSAHGPAGSLAGPSGTGAGVATSSVTKGVAYTLTATGNPAYLGTWACVDQQGTTVPVTDSKVTVAQGSQATCTVTLTTARLTLLKHVAGQPSALLASGFTLTATPSTAIAGLPAVTVPGSETVVPSGAGANSFDVRPDHEYRLTEATSYAALGLELQQYRGGYPANGVFLEAEWVTVTSPTARVAVGGHEVYRFVSAAPAPLALPLTGGVGADTYQLGGSGVLLLSFLASAFVLVRTRIRSRTAGRRA